MPSKNLIVSDKMQFPHEARVAGGCGDIQQPGPWFPDERDGFISWLRAEFAASNAIIDSLFHHLQGVAEPGEYDLVVSRVQQRRVAWNPVLHMQQFFPISDVILELQQVAWRRQQRVVDQARVGGKEFNRSDDHSFGSGYGQMAEATKELHNLSVDSSNLSANTSVTGSEEKKGMVTEREEMNFGPDIRKSDDNGLPHIQKMTDASLKSQTDSSLKPSRNRNGADYPCIESPSKGVKDENPPYSKGSCNLIVAKNSDAIQNQKDESLIISPKTFHAWESYDGKAVNMAEGLYLYENFLDEEVSKLISLVNDLRASGRRGQLPGPTFVFSRRPYRGHGREMIQLGVAIPDASSDDYPAKDCRVEPIPDLLQSVIDRFVNMQLTPTKLDTCIIDFYDEGDYSHRHSYPLRYGRPICLLSLNDCDMVFGSAIVSDNLGLYGGALNLVLSPGSLLVMQGNSTDIAKCAIPSIPKPRILIMFLKSQPGKAFQDDVHFQAPNWATSSRPGNHIRPKHYTQSPTTGVLPTPPIRAQLRPPNASAPRLPPPHLPVPGTGVFLPLEKKIAAADVGETA